MKTMPHVFTLRDWELLPEGFPAELIEGCLVKEPAPSTEHQRIGARIRFALMKLVGPDLVPDTPADVLVDDCNVYQPDIVVLAKPPADGTSYVGVPVLVVEVLSPSTRRRDRDVKRGRLLGLGVQEVWLVDPTAEAVDVKATTYTMHAGCGETIRSRALPEFALNVEALFAPPGA